MGFEAVRTWTAECSFKVVWLFGGELGWHGFSFVGSVTIDVQHVDDLVIAGREMDVEWCLAQLRERFEISEGGIFPTVNPKEPVRFLKRRRFFTADGIVIMPHERYIKGLVAMYELQNRRGKPTPDGAVSMMDLGEELIGESPLLYVAQDRLDIQNAVRTLAQAMSKPTKEAEKALKHTILYLKNTEEEGILLPYKKEYANKIDQINQEPSDEKTMGMNNIEVFSDADWGGDQSSNAKRRRSVSSVLIFVNNYAVQSYSRSQKSIALSSCESEFLALTGAAAEAMRVKTIWEFLTGQQASMVAFTDSSSCLALSQRLGVGRTKHLDVRQLWLQQEVKQGKINVGKIGTQLNLAGLNTKKVNKPRRDFLMFLIGGTKPSGDGFSPVGEEEFNAYLTKQSFKCFSRSTSSLGDP